MSEFRNMFADLKSGFTEMRLETKQSHDTLCAKLETSVAEIRGEVSAVSSRVELLERENRSLKATVTSIQENMIALESRLAPSALEQSVSDSMQQRLQTSVQQCVEASVAKRLASLHPPPAIAPPPIPVQSAAAARAGQPSRLPFVPDKMFLRGFCAYGKDATQGLSQERALKLLDLCRGHLPAEHRHVIGSREPSAPYRRNRQVTIWVREGTTRDETMECAKAWSIALKAANINWEGRGIYIVSDTDEITKMRKRAVAQARAVIEQERLLTDGAKVEPDWAAGAVYVVKDGVEHCVGTWNYKKGFVWCASEVSKLWPHISCERLAELLAEI
jgi:hypothetical protein